MFYLVFIGHEEVDVVQSVHQTMLLVAVDIKVLKMARREIGNRLVGQINLDLSIRIVLNSRKQFRQERF